MLGRQDGFAWSRKPISNVRRVVSLSLQTQKIHSLVSGVSIIYCLDQCNSLCWSGSPGLTNLTFVFDSVGSTTTVQDWYVKQSHAPKPGFDQRVSRFYGMVHPLTFLPSSSVHTAISSSDGSSALTTERAKELEDIGFEWVRVLVGGVCLLYDL